MMLAMMLWQWRELSFKNGAPRVNRGTIRLIGTVSCRLTNKEWHKVLSMFDEE